jgi:hypothetical protein
MLHHTVLIDAVEGQVDAGKVNLVKDKREHRQALIGFGAWPRI